MDTSIARIRTSPRVASKSEVLSDILLLMERFDSRQLDLPSTKNAAAELELEVIERKVIAICSIREEIKEIRNASLPLDILYQVTPFISQLVSDGATNNPVQY